MEEEVPSSEQRGADLLPQSECEPSKLADYSLLLVLFKLVFFSPRINPFSYG